MEGFSGVQHSAHSHNDSRKCPANNTIFYESLSDVRSLPSCVTYCNKIYLKKLEYILKHRHRHHCLLVNFKIF